MNFKKPSTGAAVALGMALLGLPAANANVILTYTGNDFTTFTSPYTGTDKVTASITLTNPLGDNLNLAMVTPIAFSLNDGVQTITDATPNVVGTTFEFSTNATGDIIAWFVEKDIGTSPFATTINTVNATIVQDQGVIASGANGANSHPGIWTETSVAVPEPPC